MYRTFDKRKENEMTEEEASEMLRMIRIKATKIMAINKKLVKALKKALLMNPFYPYDEHDEDIPEWVVEAEKVLTRAKGN